MATVIFPEEDSHVARQPLGCRTTAMGSAETTAVLPSVLQKRPYDEQLMWTLLWQKLIFSQLAPGP